jgi:hypothetical protein
MGATRHYFFVAAAHTVQLILRALVSVFTGGVIVKQMPRETKKFAKVDKDWSKVMTKASESQNVAVGSADELLRNSLPTISPELEKCLKLGGLPEPKQNAFHRCFYFVSNAKLLIILLHVLACWPGMSTTKTYVTADSTLSTIPRTRRLSARSTVVEAMETTSLTSSVPSRLLVMSRIG